MRLSFSKDGLSQRPTTNGSSSRRGAHSTEGRRQCIFRRSQRAARQMVEGSDLIFWIILFAIYLYHNTRSKWVRNEIKMSRRITWSLCWRITPWNPTDWEEATASPFFLHFRRAILLWSAFAARGPLRILLFTHMLCILEPSLLLLPHFSS